MAARSQIGLQIARFWGLAGAIVLMLVGQLQIQHDPPIEWLVGGYALLFTGLLLFFVVLGNNLLPSVPIPAPMALPQPFKIRPVPLLLALGLTCFAAWRSWLQPPQATLWEQLIVWGAAMLLLVLAVRPEAPNRVDDQSLRRWEIVYLLGIFVVALLIRGFGLET